MYLKYLLKGIQSKGRVRSKCGQAHGNKGNFSAVSVYLLFLVESRWMQEKLFDKKGLKTVFRVLMLRDM